MTQAARPWIIRGDRLQTPRRQGGRRNEEWQDYQKSSALARLVEMLGPTPLITGLRYEGSQDVDLQYADGTEEYVQLKSGVGKGATFAWFCSAFTGFAIDLIDALMDERESSSHLRFRLVVRELGKGGISSTTGESFIRGW